MSLFDQIGNFSEFSDEFKAVAIEAWQCHGFDAARAFLGS